MKRNLFSTALLGLILNIALVCSLNAGQSDATLASSHNWTKIDSTIPVIYDLSQIYEIDILAYGYGSVGRQCTVGGGFVFESPTTPGTYLGNANGTFILGKTGWHTFVDQNASSATVNSVVDYNWCKANYGSPFAIFPRSGGPVFVLNPVSPNALTGSIFLDTSNMGITSQLPGILTPVGWMAAGGGIPGWRQVKYDGGSTNYYLNTSVTYHNWWDAANNRYIIAIEDSAGKIDNNYSDIILALKVGVANFPASGIGYIDVVKDNTAIIAGQTATDNQVVKGDVASFMGWAVDANAGAQYVTNVQLYLDGGTTAINGTLTLGIARTDIQSGYGGNSAFLNSGWQLNYDTSSLSVGTHSVTGIITDKGSLFNIYGSANPGQPLSFKILSAPVNISVKTQAVPFGAAAKVWLAPSDPNALSATKTIQVQ